MSDRDPRINKEALVIFRRRVGEGHQIVHLLTADDEVMSVFAPAALQSQRRYGGRLRPFDTLDVVLQRGRGQRISLDVVDQTLVDRSWLNQDAKRMAAASLLVELAHVLVPEGQHSQPYFNVLCRQLDLLAMPNVELALTLGVLALLQQCGYSGARLSDRCDLCGQADYAVTEDFQELLCHVCDMPNPQPVFSASDPQRLSEALSRVLLDIGAPRLRAISLIPLAFVTQIVDTKTAV